MPKEITITVTVPSPPSVNISTPSAPQIGVVRADAIPAYVGEYAVEPGDEAVTINCSGRRMMHDIVVAPIPSNWGRIAWNGSTLSVS